MIVYFIHGKNISISSENYYNETLNLGMVDWIYCNSSRVKIYSSGNNGLIMSFLHLPEPFLPVLKKFVSYFLIFSYEIVMVV